MRRLGFAALITAGTVVMGHAETHKVDFSQDAVDQPLVYEGWRSDCRRR